MPRQYGNGSVRKRGRDAWEIQWCVSGKRYRETVRSSTKAGAQDVLRDRLQAARRGYAPSTATIDDLLDLYEVTSKDRSAKSRLAILRDRMGRLKAGAVTRQDVKRFVRYLEQDRECSPATINRYKAIWDRSYKLAVQDGLGLATPFWPRMKESAPKRDYIAPQTFAAIAEHLKRPAYRAIATVAYWTGARKGELLALTWDRVDLDAGAFLIAEAKSGTPRRVRMPEIAKNAVLELAVIRERDFPGSPWVFTLDGRQLSPNSLRGAWDRACESAGAHYRFHALRHSFATNARAAGIEEGTIMEITGHETRAVFDRYGIQPEAAMERAAEAMDRMAGSRREARSLSEKISDRSTDTGRVN